MKQFVKKLYKNYVTISVILGLVGILILPILLFYYTSNPNWLLLCLITIPCYCKLIIIYLKSLDKKKHHDCDSCFRGNDIY